MKKNLLITKFLNAMINNNVYSKCNELGINLLLFRSLLYTDSPNDVELLILYIRSTSYIDKVFEFRDSIKVILENELLIHLDISLLSYEEEKKIQFIQNEKAINMLDFKLNS